MEDTWRKAKHFGLGVLDFTREKVEALVNDMVKRGELSEQDTAEARGRHYGKGQVGAGSLPGRAPGGG